MKLTPEDKKRTMIYGGVIAVALLAALYFLFFTGGEQAPDPGTQGALERAEEQAQAAPAAPAPTAGIPLEQRPPRGAVGR